MKLMKTITMVGLLGLFESASAAVMITGKEVGIQFITGTIASPPIESGIHTQGTTPSTAVFDNKALVLLGVSEIIIDFGTVPSPIVFSNEDFSGLRFYDVSEIDFMDNDPLFALPSLIGSGLNPTVGNTDVLESGGALFSNSRVTVDENNIYVDFSGLTITQATGTKVVISLGQVVPEPSSSLLIAISVMGVALRRNRR